MNAEHSLKLFLAGNLWSYCFYFSVQKSPSGIAGKEHKLPYVIQASTLPSWQVSKSEAERLLQFLNNTPTEFPQFVSQLFVVLKYMRLFKHKSNYINANFHLI